MVDTASDRESKTWTDRLPDVAAALSEAFRAAGERLVLVGPAARALALGEEARHNRRLDFVTGAERAVVQKLVGEAVPGAKLETQGRQGVRFATDGQGPVVQLGPFRTFHRSGDRLRGRRLDTVTGDLASREITLHAIAIDEDGEVLDPFGGCADARAGRLQMILPPEDLRREPPRWMLRLARHVAYYGHEIGDDLLAVVRGHAGALMDLPPDAWRNELQRTLLHRHPGHALQYLQSAGLLRYLLPEVEALVGFDDSCAVHHKDVWAHTKLVVMRSRPEPAQRWTALLHDVGKVATRSVDRDGSVHFFRHEELSAVLFDGIAARLQFPHALADKVRFLILNHSRVNLYNDEWTDSAVRRLIRETGDHLEDLLAFSRADITSRREDRVEYIRSLMEQLERRIDEVREKDAYVPPLPSGIGNLIMTRFGIPPSPAVGALRARLEEAVENGTLPRGLTEEEYVDHLAGWLEAERERQDG